MPHKAHFQTDRRRILIVVLLGNILLAAAVASILWNGWQRNATGVSRILQSEVAFWSDALNQRFDQLQSTCLLAQQQLLRKPELLAAAGPWLRDLDKMVPFIQGITLLNAQGTVLNVEGQRLIEPLASTSIAKRPGFVKALSEPGQIQVGRPLTDALHPDQTLSPVYCALTTEDPQHPVVMVFNIGLQQVLKSVHHQQQSLDGAGRWKIAIGLLRSDGYLLARLPAPLPHTRADLARAPARGVLAREIAAKPDQSGGVFSGAVQSVGGQSTFGAWQRLSGHPIVAFTSLPTQALTTLWWRQYWSTLVGWGLLLLLQIVGGALISRSMERQHRLAQINAALAQTSKAVAEATDEIALFQSICDIAISAGGMELAWIGRPGADGKAQILAAAGKTGYLDGLSLSSNADEIGGQGPFGVVWRSAEAVFVQGGKHLDLIVPWADRMRQFGLRTMAALPVLRGSRIDAVLSIYRDSQGRITRDQRGLLEELARSMGHGLDRLDLAAAERKEREGLERHQELIRSVLAQIDILISARNDQEVLENTCTRLLETGLFAAVWVGQPDAQEKVKPLAVGGNGLDTLSAQPPLSVRADAGHALARAWQTGQEQQEDDSASPLLQPWADFSLPGWQPLALALPLRRNGSRWAVLTLVMLNSADLDDVLHALLRRVASLIEQALGEIDLKTDLEAEQAQQRHLARHDALTGLPNRLALESHLPLAMARARRHKTLLAVGVMDLDDFKPVNDTHGHAAGDQLLRQLGERLSAAVRETDLVARLGGDEFVLVLEGVARAEDLPIVLDRIHSAVETPFDLGDGVMAKVGMSLGVTLYPLDDVQPEVLLRHADAALYASKAHKRDRAAWWQPWGDGMEQVAARPDAAPTKVDPYGAVAARLLGLVVEPLEQNAQTFVEHFYAALEQDPESAAVLAALSADERKQLQSRLIHQFQLILQPELSAETHLDDARHTGSVHALVGVSTGALVKGMGSYLQSLQELLVDAPLRDPDRTLLTQAITARLQTELHGQSEGGQALREQYQEMLYGLEQMQPDLTQWADLARTLLDAVAELPGMAATVIYKPNAQGEFVPEFTAGAFDDYWHALEKIDRANLAIDPASEFGQTPHPRCWRSEQIETNASYVTDARMAPWRASAHSVGIRSSAAVPVKDSRGRMLAVMGLYGRYPGMFNTRHMLSFMRGLEQLFERGLYGLMTRRETALLPVRDRRAWRHRLFSGGLEMHYQPLVDLRSGRPTAVEALARLRLEDGGLIGPGQFLPSFGAAELTRLFTLGLEQALEQLSRWDETDLYLDLSVNLPLEVLLMPECARWVADALREHRIAPERLSVEILEDTDFQNDTERDRAVRSLAETGVRLVMDDLGSGYSSLLRLRTLPFDTVKIDQGLVRQIPSEQQIDGEGMIGFIGALVRMTQALGLKVVVEGLETPALVEVAAVLGADTGQGYALAKPMPAAAVSGWLRGFQWATQTVEPKTDLGLRARHWVRAHTERSRAAAGPSPD
ncbi:EAL domain-containing protein [Thiomonas bhubaneswarensis]|nr:EAL domain-containing protein [Thiomonas bhubaneswarensis]